MARWEGDTHRRLQRAALELFDSRGYDRVTVAEIAAAAGLTERTFYRHFADKREVLFRGQEDFEQAFLAALAGAPEGDAMALVVAALESGATFFSAERRPWSRARQRVIEATPALQERELLKLSALAAALTAALTDRGIDPVTAALAAESGVAVFRTAFAVWLGAGDERPFAEVQQGVLDQLHTLLARA